MLPQDPVILLSYVNTRLRDACTDLDDLCAQEDADRAELERRLETIDYRYDPQRNQFV